MSHNPAFILFHPEVKAGLAVIRLPTLPVLKIQLKFTFSVNESSGCTERGGPSVTWCSREPSRVEKMKSSHYLLHLCLFYYCACVPLGTKYGLYKGACRREQKHVHTPTGFSWKCSIALGFFLWVISRKPAILWQPLLPSYQLEKWDEDAILPPCSWTESPRL